MYLKAGSKLSFDAPKAGDSAFEEYVSDPAKPVTYRVRPDHATSFENSVSWARWLVDDQHEFSGRTDVVTFESDVSDGAGEDCWATDRESVGVYERHGQ